MHYRFLKRDDLRQVHGIFLESFSDYAVPMEVDEKGLELTLKTRGVDYSSSVAAFDGSRGVGIMATGVGPWSGQKAAYDIFTGVVPSYRGRGIAGAMLEEVKERVRELGVRRIVLEVLQSNASARRAYERAGFQVSRELVCLKLDREALVTGKQAAGASVRRTDPSQASLRSFDFDWQPSWQNSIESVKRASATMVCHEVVEDGVLQAFGVHSPAQQQIIQLAVAPSRRRHGLGTLLVDQMMKDMEVPSIRILNIDGEARYTLRFFESVGAVEQLRQFEMVLELD